MFRRFIGWCIFFILSTQAFSAPMETPLNTENNPVYTECSQLPHNYQKYACYEFDKLNPEYNEEVSLFNFDLLDRLRRLAGIKNNTERTRQFTRLQLVTEPSSLYSLVTEADGDTVFFLDARYGAYPLEGTISSHSSFALVGAVDTDNLKPSLKLGRDFGGTLPEMFSLELVDSIKAAIFSNLSFGPEPAEGDTSLLEFMIHASYPLEYFVIDRVDFNSSGMAGHPLRGLVSINDMRGEASIVASTMDMSQVENYGVTINACNTGLNEGCQSELLFTENNVTTPDNSGLLKIKNIQDFSIEGNDIVPSGVASFVRDSAPDSIFHIIYSPQSESVTGFFNINSVDGCVNHFPFATVVSDTGDVTPGLAGKIFYNGNTYGGCNSLHSNPTLPALIQLDGLPDSLYTSLGYIGFPVYNSSGETVLTTTVVSLTRQMVSMSASSSINELVTPTPTPSTLSSSMMPSSTRQAPTLPASAITSFSTDVSPTPSPGSASEIPPTVLPHKKKKLSGREITSIALGMTILVAMIGGYSYGVYRCIKKFESHYDVTGLWNIVTVGMCFCIVSRGRSPESMGINMNNVLMQKGTADDDF